MIFRVEVRLLLFMGRGVGIDSAYRLWRNNDTQLAKQ